MKKTVKVRAGDEVIEVEYGTLLSDILKIEKPCGGYGRCGKCKVIVNQKEELACRYTVRSDIEVELCESGEIVSESGLAESGRLGHKHCLALDIGTTTLALALVSLDNGEIVKVVTRTNPQREFGADIITRIEYCRKSSVAELHTLLIGQINRMIDDIGVDVEEMYVAANVTMLHTFFGVDCSSIGVAPYKPTFLEGKSVNGADLGINRVEKVISLPSIASFVGADVVAGMFLLGLPEDGKYNLLVDLGTNAEVALYSNESGVATAAAAGPCFEGANISSGMSATAGAIYAFKLNYGHAEYKTIADAPARGICGTGLIDIVAELLKNDIIDESGYMDNDYRIADGISLSVGDVRQYQLAKSAIFSAIASLMKRVGIGFDDIEKMYISGGFSAKINIANASASGLFPNELAAKAVPINNSSLQGLVRYATVGGKIEQLVEQVEYIDLSTDPYFSDLFIENMLFY